MNVAPCLDRSVPTGLRTGRAPAANALGRLAVCLAVAAALAGGAGRAADAPAAIDFGGFLADRGIDRVGRADLVDATSWGAPQQRAAIRVLARLKAPDALWRGWRGEALEYRPEAQAAIDDRLVALRGRAVFVAPQSLDEEERTLAGRDSFDVVRIVPDGAAGAEVAPVDVLVPRAPKAWPRWRTIDEPAAVDGLPLTTGAAPQPAPQPAGGSGWPETRPALLLAAASIAYRPATVLGTLGMDYGLFDTVRDGGKLGAADADAFYALLAAVRGQRHDDAPPTDIVPIIDTTQRWFERHRGDPVTIAGVVRKATRITVDDPARRTEIGADAYWELFVFVETPPLRVDGRDQESYPVVCVVREMPAGMPTGDRITERVRVHGFALKRYGYPLADVEIVSSQGDEAAHGRRMETALVVGRRAEWQPVPATGPTGGWLSWLFLGIIAAVAALVAALAWVRRREDRRARARARDALPERVELPPGSE
jgi:hypothetical protein